MINNTACSAFSGKGLYFLDEPEAALSSKTQFELLDFLMEAGSTGNAQFIISTHSFILMSCKAAKLYSFNNDIIEEVSFQETSHFKVYNQFFESFKNDE